MSGSSVTLRLCLVTLALAGVTFLAAPEARSITYGEPDCIDNRTNTGCLHPNAVSLSGFYRGASTARCSGSLLAENADRFIILTAAHCASTFLHRIQNRGEPVGVSFDAEIVKDLPHIGPHAWSTNQYITRGKPVLPVDYGPIGPFKNGVQNFDYAVVVFDRPRHLRFTGGRPPDGHRFVDLSGISPVTLPEQDYLLDKVSGSDPLMVTTVGYGVGAFLNGPGEGGNAGGPSADFEKLGVRWRTEHTPAFAFMGREANMFFSSQNPAQDHEGSCNGDSGGPLFYEDQGVEYQIGITSWGEIYCRATAFNARTDSARAVEFLACVTAPDAELEDILACGCTEVNDDGLCPSEGDVIDAGRQSDINPFEIERQRRTRK
jgi:hypothetical protein